jgi:hypothetical protein
MSVDAVDPLAAPRRPPRRPFHGWRIVAGGMLIQTLQSALFWQSFGAYAALWMADFGWTRTTISWAAACSAPRAACSVRSTAGCSTAPRRAACSWRASC